MRGQLCDRWLSTVWYRAMSGTMRMTLDGEARSTRCGQRAQGAGEPREGLVIAEGNGLRCGEAREGGTAATDDTVGVASAASVDD